VTTRWSPDGRYLMGGSTDFVSSDILVMPADSGPISILYRQRPASTERLVVGPDWSPDGRAIYFKSCSRRSGPACWSMSDGGVRFWSIPATGGVPRLLAQLDDPAHPSLGAWTTDGKRFFFLVNDRQSDISVMELRRK
jgi:Tol biopolymer transport system component